MREVKEILASKEYDFLREGNLEDRTALLVLGGSRAYGTDIHREDYQSDIDVRGIYLHTKEEILTCNPTDKVIEKSGLDVALYPLTKVVGLLKNCNPNIIEFLGVKEDHILKATPEARLLIDNSDIFLSQRAGNSFGGYALSQLKAIENALMLENGVDDKLIAEQLRKTLDKQMEIFAEKYTGLSKDECFVVNQDDINHRDELCITVDLQTYPVNSLSGMYSELAEINRKFGKLNHRNKKTSPTKLAKHQMHLIRLLSMGTEILSGEGINTYREKDRDFLLDIRNEKYTNDEVMEFVREREEKFNYAKKHSVLPKTCDEQAIKELVSEINLRCLDR